MAGRIGHEPANHACAGWRPAMPAGSADLSYEPAGNSARVPEGASGPAGEASVLDTYAPRATPALDPLEERASATAAPAGVAGRAEPAGPAGEEAEAEAGPVLDAGGYVPDEEALRGTRFEFGGRRPFGFVPRRPPFAGSQRPLPGIGTVALGRVVRVAPYGAFVDFLGFRGLVHISQLRPGYRVERVEDVVHPGDEVVVRVIAIDPERRHINLALMPSSAATTTAPRAAALPPRVAPAPPESAPQRQADKPAPPAAAPPPATEVVTALAAPVEAARLAASATVRPAAEVAPGRAETRPVGAGQPGAIAAPKAAAPKPAARAARPHVPRLEASRHPSRAVRREMLEPAHPMARLLASAGPEALRPVDKDRAPEAGGWLEPSPSPGAGPGPAVAPGAVVEPIERPVHEAAPVPEPEEPAGATLEALVARFGPRREPPAASRRGGDRSRLEREKQAALLARLRGER